MTTRRIFSDLIQKLSAKSIQDDENPVQEIQYWTRLQNEDHRVYPRIYKNLPGIEGYLVIDYYDI